jgi:autotransporter strand-loop-strand O-heptosyltransferase
MKENVFFQMKGLGLGDTISSIPLANLHNIEKNKNVFLMSNFSDLFSGYDNIVFIKEYQMFMDNDRVLIDHNNQIFNMNDMYILGYHTTHHKFIDNKSYFQIRKNERLPLQRQFAKFLDIDFKKEIKPKIHIDPNYKSPYEKYICIATQTTMQGKYWNYPNGWEVVIEYLKKIGYTVLCIDKHSSYGLIYNNNIPKNAIDKTNLSLKEAANLINNCDFFIGLDSGLSWLAWALNKEVVQILGLTGGAIAFENKYRVINEKVCNTCFSDRNIKQFDSDMPFNDFLLCPKYKNTNKIFECTKSITPEEVIKKINILIS